MNPLPAHARHRDGSPRDPAHRNDDGGSPGTGHSHGHGHGHGERERLSSRALAVLAAVIAPIALAVGVGMVALWPSGSDTPEPVVPYAVPGATFPGATVVSVTRFDCTGDPATGGPPAPRLTCGRLAVRLDHAPNRDQGGGGPDLTVEVPDPILRAGIEEGTRIRLVRVPAADGAPESWQFFDFVRGVPLTLLAIAFAVVVVGVARLRGLAALLGLAFAFAVLLVFMLPALLAGESPIAVGLVGSTAIMLVVLYVAHGLSARTTVALAGTLFGLVTTALLAGWATGAAHLTGFGNDSGASLATQVGGVDLRGLVLCGMIVAGLGVLNDVTVTQASAVWELHETAPALPARQLFARAMRIGRDHIASAVYTIAFAYAGTALPVLLLIRVLDRPIRDVLTSEDIAEEIARTLVGSIGLVLAIPVTTAIAVAVVRGTGRPRSGPDARRRP